MKKPVRPVLIALTALALCLALAVLAWLPWDPFEDPAGPLDRMVPADVDAAVRMDGAAVRASPLARAIWTHPQVERLKEQMGLEARILAPLRQIETRVRDLSRDFSLGLADDASVIDDLFGGDVVAAVRDGELLLLTRISARAHAIELIRKLDPVERARHGVMLQGPLIVVDRGGEGRAFVGRHRDVLVLATSSDLASEALDLAASGRGSVASLDGYAEALHGEGTPGPKLYGWVDPSGLGELLDQPQEGSAAQFWLSLFPAHTLRPMAWEADLSSPDRLVVDLRGDYGDVVPQFVESMAGAAPPDASELWTQAARYAVSGETVAVCGVGVPGADVVSALLSGQPRPRRMLLEELLAEHDETPRSVSQRLGRHFLDGVSVVVARLQEADELDLDDWNHGAVHPVPATLVVFRLREIDGERRLLEDLARDAKALFGADLDLEPDRGPAGERIYRLTEHGFGLEWSLLRPSVAFTDDGRFLFCTHDGYLERALLWSRSASPSADREGATASLTLDGDGLRRYVADQRWEFAERQSFRDWRQERRDVRAELLAADEVLSPEEIDERVDAEIDRRVEERNRSQFPEAMGRFHALWTPLDLLGDSRMDGSLDERRFRIRLEIHVRR